MPLGVALTGYRLLAIAVTLGVGIPKAILSYRGQSLIPSTLDMVGGTAIAVLYVFIFDVEVTFQIIVRFIQ